MAGKPYSITVSDPTKPTHQYTNIFKSLQAHPEKQTRKEKQIFQYFCDKGYSIKELKEAD